MWPRRAATYHRNRLIVAPFFTCDLYRVLEDSWISWFSPSATVTGIRHGARDADLHWLYLFYVHRQCPGEHRPCISGPWPETSVCFREEQKCRVNKMICGRWVEILLWSLFCVNSMEDGWDRKQITFPFYDLMWGTSPYLTSSKSYCEKRNYSQSGGHRGNHFHSFLLSTRSVLVSESTAE